MGRLRRFAGLRSGSLALAAALCACSTSGAPPTQAGACGATTETFTASGTDESAVLADGTSRTVTNAAISSTSVTSNTDEASAHGLAAAVLARNGGTIDLSCATVTTTGQGASGVFALGIGSSIALDDVDITTTGVNSPAIATEGGTVSVTGGIIQTSGAGSPSVDSTGIVTVTGAMMTSTGSEAAVVDGASSVTLIDTTTVARQSRGVMIYRSTSGGAAGGMGTFTMNGGELSAAVGPLFYVTNATGVIDVTGSLLTAGSGVFLQAAADRWGAAGSNGGSATLTAHRQTMIGDVVVDAASSILLTLADESGLTGTINAANGTGRITLTLDASSAWTVTGDSHLTCLASGGISGTTITNVIGNGFTVRYEPSACSALGGATYTLGRTGGTLTPSGASVESLLSARELAE